MPSQLHLDIYLIINHMENFHKGFPFILKKNVTWGHPNINKELYKFSICVGSMSYAF